MSQDFNPYQAPKAALEVQSTETENGLLAEPSRCAGFAANEWFGATWKTIADNPTRWMLIGFIWALVYLAAQLLGGLLGIIPILGTIVGTILSMSIASLLSAGFILAFHTDANNDEPEVSHLFAGFNTRFWDFVILTLITVGLIILAIVPVGIIAGIVGFSGLAGFNTGGTLPASSMLTIALLVLVLLALIIPVAMAIWFAPALMLLNDLKPVEAIKLSFKGCWTNFLPFLWYGILVFLAMLALYIVVGGLGFLLFSVLGWFSFLIIVPAAIAIYSLVIAFGIGMSYHSYRDIFLD